MLVYQGDGAGVYVLDYSEASLEELFGPRLKVVFYSFGGG